MRVAGCVTQSVEVADWRGPGWARRAKRLNAIASANPDTKCTCGRRLDEHPRTRTGNPPTWSQEHLVKGNPHSPVVPMVLGCNSSEGASYGNRMRAQGYDREW